MLNEKNTVQTGKHEHMALTPSCHADGTQA